ncbi:MAG: hypothetical protein AAF502_01950 [Bacteroidota bacterium]
MKTSKIKFKDSFNSAILKLSCLFLLTAVMTFSGCKKDEIPELPDNPTELDYFFQRFLYSIAPQEQDMPVYEILDAELLQALTYLNPENYLEELIGSIEYAEEIGNPVVVYLGLQPLSIADDMTGPLFQFDHMISSRLERSFAPFPQDGAYVLQNLLVATTAGENNLINLNSIVPNEVAKKAEKGGICATLAIAHSLVGKHGIIPKDGRGNWPDITETRNDTVFWKSDFLKKIYDASGDNDGSRGLSDDEVDKAHTSDWNGNWLVHRSKNMTEIMKPSDKPSASELKEWCKKLKEFNDEKKDDCLLRARGTLTYKDKETGETKTKRVGHMMTITKVEEVNGKCKITVVNTGVQDRNNDWENVPFDPKEQEWEISTTDAKITKNNGWGNSIVWDDIACVCYDEDPKRDGVTSTDLGEPGEAIK